MSEDPAVAQADPSARSYPGTPAAGEYCPEIWALGLRNPWRFSFDRGDPVTASGKGDLFIGDVGQDFWEEIDLQPAGTGAGANYGWRIMEGPDGYSPGSGDADYVPPLTAPLLSYDHSVGRCSVTGGYRYRGTKIPAIKGQYLFGDFCSGQLWGWSGGTSAAQLLNTGLNIVGFGEDGDGEVYVAHWDSARGAVYRVVKRGR